jgi:hypothetical protein
LSKERSKALEEGEKIHSLRYKSDKRKSNLSTEAARKSDRESKQNLNKKGITRGIKECEVTSLTMTNIV